MGSGPCIATRGLSQAFRVDSGPSKLILGSSQTVSEAFGLLLPFLATLRAFQVFSGLRRLRPFLKPTQTVFRLMGISGPVFERDEFEGLLHFGPFLTPFLNETNSRAVLPFGPQKGGLVQKRPLCSENGFLWPYNAQAEIRVTCCNFGPPQAGCGLETEATVSSWKLPFLGLCDACYALVRAAWVCSAPASRSTPVAATPQTLNRKTLHHKPQKNICN